MAKRKGRYLFLRSHGKVKHPIGRIGKLVRTKKR